MNKTTEALKLALEYCDDNMSAEAANVLRMALADHIANTDKMVGCDYCDNPLFAGTKCNNCGRVTLAEPVKQEPVGEVVLERMGVGDAQIVRFQMYGKIPPVGTKLYAAPVSAKREWVDLTDGDVCEAAGIDGADEWFYAAVDKVIAAFKEKNK